MTSFIVFSTEIHLRLFPLFSFEQQQKQQQQQQLLILPILWHVLEIQCTNEFSKTTDQLIERKINAFGKRVKE